MGKGENKLIGSCVRATELIEKKQIFGLSVLEQVQLRLHTTLCMACRNYQFQSATIDGMLEQQQKNDVAPEGSLDDGRKRKIINEIKNI